MFMLPWRRHRSGSADETEEETTPAEEARLPLHVLAHDAVLSVENGMLAIDAEDSARQVRPEEISLLALHAGAHVTVPCLQMLARRNVPLILLSRNGYYLGQFCDLSGQQAGVRRAQLALADAPARSLALARLFVAAKIDACTRLCRRRLGARHPATRRLRRHAKDARRARSLASLRGTEGSAAATWFATWPEILGESESIFTFDTRSRRPPRDAINALMSYMYAVLTGTAASAALAAGLDVSAGFYHAARPGRPALALDLVEPLRPAVADAAIFQAIRQRRFGEDSFEVQPDGSWRLSDIGRRCALEVLEHRLSTSFVYDGTEMTWRVAITHMAELLARALREGHARLPMPLPKG